MFLFVGPWAPISCGKVAKTLHVYKGQIMSNMGQAGNLSITMEKKKKKSALFIFT